MSELLKKIIVVIPSGSRISYPTERMFGYFSHERIVRLSGCSDVGLARNLAAGMALKRLQEFPDAPAVLWLDDDMFAPIEIVAKHVATVLDLAHNGKKVAISGVYPQRQNTTKVAASYLSRVPSDWVPSGLFPALPGMGCMAYESSYFVELAKASPRFMRDDGEHFAMFSSGLLELGQPGASYLEWIGEDINHAVKAWNDATKEHGGIFVDPSLLYGHICELILTAAPTSTVVVFDEERGPVPLGSFQK